MALALTWAVASMPPVTAVRDTMVTSAIVSLTKQLVSPALLCYLCTCPYQQTAVVITTSAFRCLRIFFLSGIDFDQATLIENIVFRECAKFVLLL